MYDAKKCKFTEFDSNRFFTYFLNTVKRHQITGKDIKHKKHVKYRKMKDIPSKITSLLMINQLI